GPFHRVAVGEVTGGPVEGDDLAVGEVGGHLRTDLTAGAGHQDAQRMNRHGLRVLSRPAGTGRPASGRWSAPTRQRWSGGRGPRVSASPAPAGEKPARPRSPAASPATPAPPVPLRTRTLTSAGVTFGTLAVALASPPAGGGASPRRRARIGWAVDDTARCWP